MTYHDEKNNTIAGQVFPGKGFEPYEISCLTVPGASLILPGV